LQLVDYSADGDVVLCSAHSNQLKKYGWKTSRNNIPTAYLTGMLLGRKAVQKKIKEAIADIGLYASTKGSRLYAAMKGAVDAGLYLPHDEEILPSPERLAGSHIAGYAKHIRKEPEKFDKQFADYKKQAIEPDKFQEYFEKVKEKIRNENKN
jgi:large subunit ribosomal protein L18